MLLSPYKCAVSGPMSVHRTLSVCEMSTQVLWNNAVADQASPNGQTGMMDRDAASNTTATQKNVLLSQLTPREREVIELVVRGATDRELARDLGISTNTINEHIMAIKRKIGAANRVSIATIYYGDTPYYVPAKDEGQAGESPIEVAPAYASYVARCAPGGHRS
jgi:DNA-binding CsgD family transcriptional regulator